MRRVLALLALTVLAAMPLWRQAHAQGAEPRTMTTSDTAPAKAGVETTKAPAPAAKAAAQPADKAGTRGSALVDISGDTSQGYGRIQFQWSGPVGYDVSLSDGILVITFDRAFKLPANKASVPLDGYVALIRQDANQRTLRLSLSGKFRLHQSQHGRFVAIDLVPSSYRGDPPDVVDPAIKPVLPKSVADVKMTIGVHQDKTRLVFDWGEVVPYKVSVADGKLKAEFAREGRIEVARLNNNPPAFVRSARVSAGDDKTLLDIDIDPDSKVQDFTLKTKVVFDVMAPTNDADAEISIVVPEEMQPKPDAKPKEDHHEAPAHGDDHAAAESKPAEAKPAPSQPAHDETPADSHGEPAEHAAASKPAHDDAHGAAADHGKAPDAEPQGHGGHGEEPTAHAAEERPHADDPHAVPADSHASEAEAAPETPAPPFKIARVRDDIVLTLPVSAGRGAAMFQDGNHIFIVFEGDGAVDTAAITKTAKDVVMTAQADIANDVTILTLLLAKPSAVTAQVVDGGWVAVLSKDALEPPRPVVLLRDERIAGVARVRATLERARRVVEWKDPLTGERLLAALASGPPQGVISRRGYVEFDAPSTAQGVAVHARADDLVMNLDDHDVVISTRNGLILSAGTVNDYAPNRQALGDELRPAAMDFEAWQGTGNYLKDRSDLLIELGKADLSDPKSAEEGRLALARFYLANDLGAEAMGQLNLVLGADETSASDPTFKALRSAALILLGRYKEAREDLRSASLDDDPSAQLFRAVAAAGLRDWTAARDAAIRGESAIAAFRPDWQARFRLAGAAGAVETNAADTAERMLKAIPRKGVPRRLLLEADLIRGRLAASLKQFEDAQRFYAAVISSNYRPLAVRAAVANIMLQEQMHELTPEKAIEQMASLRWQWRGDDVELDILHKLGGLEIAKGDYRSGLQTWRSAVIGFPEADETRTITGEMAALFEDLFLGGRADSMTPVQALGLYYDFRELTPIGVRGDEMVRKLADRLIAVDLLDQAAALLAHQVEKRLDGVARAQVAAKLAAVYLMARQPEKALGIIRSTAQTRLPDDLMSQRRLLTGRALSDLKQYEAALETFEQDEGPEADRLRADIHWAASDWPASAAALEHMLAGRETQAKPLDAVERTDILRIAIAYTMAEDEKGLASLRDRYLAKMADAPEAAAFAVVTRAIDPGGVAFRDLAKTVASVDTLDLFLQSLGLGKPAEGSAAK